jgi:hypothetical protein
MKNKDQILLEDVYDLVLENYKWKDVEELMVKSFMTSGGGHPPDYTFDQMLKMGYKFYYPYFRGLSHHEGMANVIFVRSDKKPTEEVAGDFYFVEPEKFKPMLDEKTFKKDLEKVFDEWNEWEMDAIGMGNPRVKGWGI